jgi:heme oxygenase
MNKFSFVDRMKEETWTEHEASKNSNFAKGIMSGDFGQQGFIEWQRALYPIYFKLETILKKKRKDPALHVFDHRKLDRSHSIYLDLQKLGTDPILEPSPLKTIVPYIAAIEKASAVPQRLMAYHYTRYMGDMNGGQVIARAMENVCGIDKNALTCYDFSELGDTYHYRKQYKTLLELSPWTEEEREAFIDEAKIAYARNADFFEELYEYLTIGK